MWMKATIEPNAGQADCATMDPVPWYSEATLMAGNHCFRAGTLIQCVRKWNDMKAADRPVAVIKLSVQLDGASTLGAASISRLVCRPDFLRA
jgi:hypothetical protein